MCLGLEVKLCRFIRGNMTTSQTKKKVPGDETGTGVTEESIQQN